MPEIVDSHVHIEQPELVGPLFSAEAVIDQMDEAGIARACAMTFVDTPAHGLESFRYLVQAVRRCPDRLIGYARVDPLYPETADLLREAFEELGFKGVKLHQESLGSLPSEPELLDVIRLASRYRAPVLFHSGDEPLSLPLQIAHAAEAVPEATIIMAHCGGYFHVDEAIAVAERYDNLLIDTSGMPYPEKIREAVRRLGPERVLFASDGPGCNPALELKKLELAGLSDRERRLVLGENTLALLERVTSKG